MDAEKNVVEAARRVVKEATHIHREVCPIRATLINSLESALSAYDSAPALPAGTVVARLEWLRLMLTVAKQRDCTEIVDEIEGFLAKLPRPEPPKELVEKWEREAMEYAWEAPVGITPRAAYVAALRAAWEAEKWGA